MGSPCSVARLDRQQPAADPVVADYHERASGEVILDLTEIGDDDGCERAQS